MIQNERRWYLFSLAFALLVPVIANAIAFSIGDTLRLTDTNMQLPTVQIGRIDDTRMIVLYAESGEGFISVLTRDGSSLTRGTTYTLGTTIFRGEITMLDSTHAVIVYADDADSNAGKAVVATITGTSVSLGTPVEFDSATSNDSNYTFAVAKVDSTRFAVAYHTLVEGFDRFGDPENSNSGALVIGTVSGTNITFGTTGVYSRAAVGAHDLAALDSGHLVVTYRANGNLYAIAGSVSGTNVTFGTPTQFASGGDYAQNDALDATHFIVAYQGGDALGKARIGVVSGTSISFGAAHDFSSATTTAISVAAIDSTSAAITYDDYGGGTRGTVTIASVIGNTVSTADASVFGTAMIASSSITLDRETTAIGYDSNDDNLAYIRLVYRDLPLDDSSDSSSSSADTPSRGGGRRGSPGRGGVAKPLSRLMDERKPAEAKAPATEFEKRTCDRVMKWYKGNGKMLGRVNARLEKRFGFKCGA